MTRFDLHRSLPADDPWDLVVAGGGPAGCCAALAGARRGLRVLLLEATGCLGGMGTAGLVCAFDPMANGETRLVRGIMGEIVDAMHRRGQLGPFVTPDNWRRRYHCWTAFHPEGLKQLLDDLMVEAGVAVRFFTRVCAAQAEDQAVQGLICADVEGLRYVPARAVVDATGDAAVAAQCGAACRQAGRDTPRIMPATMTMLLCDIHWEECGGDRQYAEQHRLFLEAIEDGHFSLRDRQMAGGLDPIGPHLGYLNSGHIFDLDATSTRSLSDGMMEGRRRLHEFVDFFRKYVPWGRDAALACTGALLGVRESRRVVGDSELTGDDILARRQFPDQIGVFNKFIDIHPYDCSDEEWERFVDQKDRSGRIGPGECFGLPYGMIVARGWRNLWVAGRCAATDVPAQGSVRVMPAAGMMGQAAGVAASLALRDAVPAGAVDRPALISALRDQGAYLPQPD